MLTLPQAVYKMTALAAQNMGFADRGRIEPRVITVDLPGLALVSRIVGKPLERGTGADRRGPPTDGAALPGGNGGGWVQQQS